MPGTKRIAGWLSGLPEAYKDRTVLVTGHTGFKGSWLCEWLLQMGARVVGVALAPSTEPSLFEQLELRERLEHHLLDIRQGEKVVELIMNTKPDHVFHLAAQPLVRLSYSDPVNTYATNVMGTVHVLEGLRRLQAEISQGRHRVCAAVMVTTDKVYQNREWVHGYREEDPLGGHDPYSSSKAGAELAIASFRESFSLGAGTDMRVGIASARAGNVIGGGDWAQDRIVPDCVRALLRGDRIRVRNPHATRPWQHVLEPLGGYLVLAQRVHESLAQGDLEGVQRYCSAYNFGPELRSNRTVGNLVAEVVRHWVGDWEVTEDRRAPHEAGRLNLTWDKAFHGLGWAPQWGFDETVARTVGWYKCAATYQNAAQLVKGDIAAFAGAPYGLSPGRR